MHFMTALQSFLDPMMLLLIVGGTTLGIIIGALPGLSATMGVALLLPMTFYMEPAAGIVMLMGIYTGAVYGGSFAAILLNIPGAPPAVMTTLDGYPMALRGEAGRAIRISTISSTFGGIVGVVAMIILSPMLARLSLKFGPPEYTVLAIFGLCTIVAVSPQSMVKGFISVALGLLLGTVGMDLFTNIQRFTFGNINLYSGINFIPIVIGLFGLSEVFAQTLEIKVVGKALQKINRLIPTKDDIAVVLKNFLPPSIVGTVVGVLPGAGGTIASVIAYNQAVTTSKNRANFGKGAPEGIIASEASNNAAVGGSMVPLLTLGVPGSSPSAVLLGALLIHNLRPGPLLFTQQPVLINQIFIGTMIAQVAMLVVGLLMAKVAPRIITVSKRVMIPIIFLLCVVGAYAISNSMFDVWIMLAAGVAGLFFKWLGIKPAPLILGLILGPMFEKNLRSTLELTSTGYAIFFTRPITIVLWILTLLIVLFPLVQKRMFSKPMDTIQGSDEG
jgi:putative tricarboxylic transport membrane protein